ESKARRILILNLQANEMQPPEELGGIGAADHLAVIRKFAPDFKCDFAIADESIMARSESGRELEAIVKDMSGNLIVAELAASPGSNHHDPEKLSSVFRNIFATEVIR
ncbi:MAG: hypothetical protein ACK55Z_04800, partial [bacterium]